MCCVKTWNKIKTFSKASGFCPNVEVGCSTDVLFGNVYGKKANAHAFRETLIILQTQLIIVFLIGPRDRQTFPVATIAVKFRLGVHAIILT